MSGNQQLHFASASTAFGQLTLCLREEGKRILQAKTELDKQAAELEIQTEALAKVRRQMVALGVADNDVLDLSVGGVPMSIKRATLIQVEGSLLAGMFSGRWEHSLNRDSQGRIFLDVEPYCFQQILTFLRCRLLNMAMGEETPEPIIGEGRQHAYQCLVEYLGLEGELGSNLDTSYINSPDDVEFSDVEGYVVVNN